MAFKLDNIPNKKTPLKEEGKGWDVNSVLKKEINLFGNSFSAKKKEYFFSEMAVLLQADIPLKDVLTLITEEQKKRKDKVILEHLLEQIIAGKSFSETLQERKEFSEYDYYSIQIGEETGTLKQVSQELGDFYKRRNEQKRNVVSALVYPIVILITAMLSVLFMLRYVVPMFADIFKQNKVELPWITKRLITLSEFIQHYSGMVFLGIIALLILRKLINKKPLYQKYKTSILLKIPFVGELIRKVYFAQFTQAIALLTKAKVPLQHGMQLTAKMIPFYPLQKALEQVEEDLITGKTLSESMQSHPIFDSRMITLLKVAEETNQTEYIFDRMSKQYSEQVQYQSKLLSTIIEPFIIIFLGIVVGAILIAMYLPMFKLSTVLG